MLSAVLFECDAAVQDVHAAAEAEAALAAVAAGSAAAGERVSRRGDLDPAEAAGAALAADAAGSVVRGQIGRIEGHAAREEVNAAAGSRRRRARPGRPCRRETGTFRPCRQSRPDRRCRRRRYSR